jgi:hypothetical protein
MSSESNKAYVLSRIPHQQRYGDLVGLLGGKKKGTALQLLPFYEQEDTVVAPLTKLTTDTSKVQAIAAHHLLRLAAQSSLGVAKNPQHASSLETLEALLLGKDLNVALATLWTLASYARYAEEPRKGLLIDKVRERERELFPTCTSLKILWEG